MQLSPVAQLATAQSLYVAFCIGFSDAIYDGASARLPGLASEMRPATAVEMIRCVHAERRPLPFIQRNDRQKFSIRRNASSSSDFAIAYEMRK